jgi:hypothetical protein
MIEMALYSAVSAIASGRAPAQARLRLAPCAVRARFIRVAECVLQGAAESLLNGGGCACVPVCLLWFAAHYRAMMRVSSLRFHGLGLCVVLDRVVVLQHWRCVMRLERLRLGRPGAPESLASGRLFIAEMVPPDSRGGNAHSRQCTVPLCSAVFSLLQQHLSDSHPHGQGACAL